MFECLLCSSPVPLATVHDIVHVKPVSCASVLSLLYTELHTVTQSNKPNLLTLLHQFTAQPNQTLVATCTPQQPCDAVHINMLCLSHNSVVQFVSRPFVVGDRVELRTATGASVVLGLVERISPMNTTFRSDQNIPISIPNK